MSFADGTFAALLDALAAPRPTPGGGTAAAAAGAMGASLLIKVAGLARSRHNTDAEQSALAAARVALEPARARLAALADADAEAFSAVMAALRRPKATDEDKAARRDAIQQALQGATLVPLETVQICAGVLAQGETVAAGGNPSASSDIEVAIGLIEAAGIGAAANVRTNLDGIADAGFTASTAAQVSRLVEATSAAAQRARAALAA